MESEACRQSLRSATQRALACCLVLDALAIFPQRFRFTRAAWVDDVFPQRDEARSSVSFAQGRLFALYRPGNFISGVQRAAAAENMV